MSQEKLQTMVMQKSWGVIEVYYGILQVVNCDFPWFQSIIMNKFRQRKIKIDCFKRV